MNRIKKKFSCFDFTPTVSFFLVAFIMIFLYAVMGYAPFGKNSLAVFDANIQYLDFFAFFKDVLAGENSIGYTFSKTLGGSNIALFSYYLASPLNLLVLFFDKTDLYSFFNIVVLLKLSIAACAFSLFLKKRFELRANSSMSEKAIVIILSLGYALGQFSIAQSNNIMWLDGVYMLPFMMIGVYEVVTNKSMWKLALTAGLAIIFNWYSAGINCLFVIVYFFFELVLNEVKTERTLKSHVKEGFFRTIEFGIAMATGVLLSCILFLPTFSALKNIRGGFDLSLLTDFGFIGKAPNVIQNYVIGGKSVRGSVSLFCGVFAMIGCVSCFLSSKISKKVKVVLFTMLSFTVFMFYWKPLSVVFSLLKEVGSFWYRYSYLGIAVILYLAGYYYFSKGKSDNYLIPLKSGTIFAASILLLDYINPTQDTKYTYFTAFMFFGVSAAVSLILYLNNRSDFKYTKLKRAVKSFILILCVFELMLNARALMNAYHVSDLQAYQSYVSQAQKQIDEIKAKDGTNYRISQTNSRNSTDSFLVSAIFNESAAYNYRSICGYTSATDDIQNIFMDKMGYRTNGLACIVASPVLATDSLLGVKYVLSEKPVEGYQMKDGFSTYNKKDVYENPYCLPFAFTYTSPIEKINEELNPFEYQNAAYSQLLGKEADLYTPIEYKFVEKETDDGKMASVYELNIPTGNYVLYGNIPKENLPSSSMISVNGVYESGYSGWMSPSVFYIPTYDDSAKTAEVQILSDKSYIKDENNVQFYALNLDKLEQASKSISENEVQFTKFENGCVELDVSSDKKQRLYLSIPYDKGWKIEVNGEKAEPELFADCMMTLQLNEGDYKIRLKYEVPGLKPGIVVSCAGVAALAALIIYDRKYRKREGEEL